AAYRFAGYRSGRRECEPQTVGISVHALGAGQLRIQARAQLPAAEPARAREQRWRLGFAAVIEADDDTLGYWALRHTSDKPDFHAADSFGVELA
ncbi:MAG: hypothetical protein JSR15_06435, partial [Proteobacteria bacterium]|nr:hypothetical protein [Pseudomonadota bacterium]